jgi:hypothetical protein
MSRLERTVIAVGVAVGCFWAGYGCGALRTTVRAYHSVFEREERAIREVLNSDPAFSRVEVTESMDGEAHLRGEVETEADKERLRAAMIKAFGERRGTEFAGSVQVRTPKR